MTGRARTRLLLLCLGVLAPVAMMPGQGTFGALPTSGGAQHFQFPVTFTFGPGLGQTSSDVFPGAFAVRPVKGDCVTTPVTEIAVSRLGVLQS